jgi:hypothetical protein
MSLADPCRLSLQREPMQVFLRRPGAAEHLLRVLLPPKVAIELAGLGRLDLEIACVDKESTATGIDELAPACESFSLWAGTGRLLIDRSLSRRLVDKVIGAAATPLLLPLSRIERGVLGGLVAGSAAKLGLPLAVGLEAGADFEEARVMTCIRMRASLAGLAGEAWMYAPAAGIEGCLKVLGPSVGVAMELAQTWLPKGEALGASAGDLVVFDETAAYSPASSWPLQLRCGERRLPVLLDEEGGLRGGASTVSKQAWPARLAGGMARAEEQVFLTAEIGRLEESSERTSKSPRGDGILLYLDEQAWAEGTLASYDGRLAVRITRVIARG